MSCCCCCYCCYCNFGGAVGAWRQCVASDADAAASADADADVTLAAISMWSMPPNGVMLLWQL